MGIKINYRKDAEGYAIKIILQFIKYESTSSILLLIVSVIAIIWANSRFELSYFNLFKEPLLISLYNLQYKTTLNHLINEGLMTIFFLLVTLEVKRELIIGELNTISKALLPVIAAMGGMLLPAAFYIVLNVNDSAALRGWAIPTATDIAFSLAIISLLGSRVPYSLKAFLTALAIIDDLGAIIIIALVYTSQLHFIFLLIALFLLLLLIILNRLDIGILTPYMLIGILLWLCILNSGIHATIAGVLLGLTIPLHNTKGSPLKNLERQLHPFVAFFILPLFALANTGLSFKSISLATLFHPVTLGIFLGLFLGKQLGIFLASWLTVKAGWAKLPNKMNGYHLYGLSLICGIGFTMSLFIGDLAFSDDKDIYNTMVKLGVLSGSILSGLMGSLVLWKTSEGKKIR